jgi:nucleoside-diphosphate-sugar epimerase
MALMLLIGNDKAKGQVVDVGGSREVTILELAKTIKKLAKCKSQLAFHSLPRNDPKRRCPNTSKLKKLTGWKPKMTFEKGLARTIARFSSGSLS